MRPAAALLSVVLLGAALAGVVSGSGRFVNRDEPVVAVPEVVPPVAPPARRPVTASRKVEPAVVAPPAIDADDLEWAEPREPLSELSLALPLKPKPRGGAPLFRPVPDGSAVFEAMGYRVSIAGTVSVAPGETCRWQETEWPCGVRAQTAFRMWLRGRAPACDLPEDATAGEVSAACRLGSQDAGAWLVSNGWARAAPGGPYAERETLARENGKGIFGPPPDTSGLPPPPAAIDVTPLADQPVLSGSDPASP